jgi:transaldolase
MRPQNYFLRLAQQTPTEFWINNPTREHASLAISCGATGCTNNPSYSQKMVDHPLERPYALNLLDQTIRDADGSGDVAVEFQRRLVKPISEQFLPLYHTSGGRRGHVSIQGDPLQEGDPDLIIRDALENRELAPNICCKIPTTHSGLQSMEYLVSKDVPLNATEIFAVHQAVEICEAYQRVSGKVGKAPPLYISHIAGIYDDYLQEVVQRESIDISPDVLWQAGLAVSRKVYQIMEDRHYPGTLVAGGARGLHHFTEMVGGKVCCTINWEGTADQLLKMDPPVVYRLFNPVPEQVIAELMEKLPDFKRGYLEDGLEVDEFEDFGPVCHFRNMFIKSWSEVTELIRTRQLQL